MPRSNTAQEARIEYEWSPIDGMSDEAWVTLGGMDDAAWYDRIEADFGIDARPQA